MIHSYNPKLAGEWYTPVSQADDNQPFRVQLRRISGMQLIEVNAAQGPVGQRTFHPLALRLLWRYGVIGMEGLEVADEEAVQGLERCDLIEDPLILQEVAGQIAVISQPTPREKKASGSPGPSPASQAPSTANDAAG